MALVGPLYSVFLLVFVSGIIQTQGSFYLLSGVACLTFSPIFYVIHHKNLIRPQSAADAAQLVRSVKRQVRLLSMAGLTLVSIFIVQGSNFGPVQLLGFLTGIVGNVVLLTVVGADFMLSVLRSAHVQHKASQGTELQASLSEKLEALESLDHLPPAKAPLARPPQTSAE